MSTRNPVKKNMDKFTRPSVVPDKKKEQKKGKRKHKGGEDAIT